MENKQLARQAQFTGPWQALSPTCRLFTVYTIRHLLSRRWWFPVWAPPVVIGAEG